MQRYIIQTDRAPAAIGPYSQAVVAGDFVYCSGQIPLDPSTGELVGGDDVAAQTTQVMRNLEAVLSAAESSFAKVVKATIYLQDLSTFASVNAVYATFFEGVEPPSRATVEVAALPRGALVEIELVALR